MKRKYYAAILILMMLCAGCADNRGADNINAETVSVTTEEMTVTSAETEPQLPAGEEYLSALERDGDIWYNTDEKYADIVDVLKKRYEYSKEVQGIVLAADDTELIFCASLHSYERDGVTKVNPYTTYETGSLTKMFTASSVFLLCEQGKLQLDDELGKYFPGYEDTPTAKITVYQLLHMQSGIYDMAHHMTEFMPEDADEDMKARAKKGELTDDEFIELVFSKELRTEPGTIFEYSNTNYKLLALIVENVSGQSFSDFVKENIFDKCGMEHSSIAAQGDVTSVPRDTKEPYCTYTYFIRGAGDMHSCAADLIAFDRALFAKKVIGESSLEEMFNMDKSYGCGWYIEKANPEHYIHGGDVGNYISFNAVYNAETEDRIYLVEFFPNKDNDTQRLMYQIYDTLRLEIEK
ncbi:MAG: beta-lactamase family protein [Oscillospiraceae bacterium]|nr:beta-lactamase family protein [Oscillospiraceae bacterium]